MTQSISVAIVGATGVVGETLVEILEERKFPCDELHLLASDRSIGKGYIFRKKRIPVQDLSEFDFAKVQLAFFSAGSAVSEQYVPKATERGCIVIDNTSRFRDDTQVPLIIPEVNLHALGDYENRKIIANPNCSTIQMLVALKPIYDAVGIERINVATYQSVSGTGKEAIGELAHQTSQLLNGQPIKPNAYPIQIAFNLIPHIDDFQENGYTREEMKMVWETQKILEDTKIQVNPTAVRVPVFFGHSEAIHIETKEKITAEQARQILSQAPGVKVKDAPKAKGYPSPVVDAAGKDPVFIGRIREDLSHPRGLNLWVVADNIRKGAALNSIQIAEEMIRQYL